MKTKLQPFFCFVTALATLAAVNARFSTACAQGTAFTYQGRLNSGTNPVTGSYDLAFSVYSAGAGGGSLAGPVTNTAVPVTNGLFATAIDFGAGVFTGGSNWLSIAVRTNGGGAFTALTPRLLLTPTPYAIYAEGAAAAGLNGTIPAADFSGTYGGSVSLTNANNSFTGNGGGLTSVNASLLGGLGATNFWQTAGNAGTAPGVNYIGTSDNEPLQLRANNTTGLQLQYTSAGSFLSSQSGINLVGGYWGNTISNGVVGGTIAGGGDLAKLGVNGYSYPNVVSGSFGTVGGGLANTAGIYGTVPGGFDNLATGQGSFAAGQLALATNAGAFVWSDGSQTFSSAVPNSFNVLATGGFNLDAGSATVTITGNLNLASPTIIEAGGRPLFVADAQQNFFAGSGAANTFYTGIYNTGIGDGAFNSLSSGSYNTAVGYQALYDLQSGANNSAFGAVAMAYNSTGTNNTASGAYALSDAANSWYVTGGGNTADGAWSLGNDGTGYNNTAGGYQSLLNNSSGYDNVGIGVNSFYDNATGWQNTAVGTYAFQSLTAGNGNVGLGYNAGANLNAGTNNIYIGNAGHTSENGMTRIGLDGTQTDTYLAGNSHVNGLSVDKNGNNTSGTLGANALVFGGDLGGIGEGICSKRGGPDDLEFYTGWGNRMTILNGGNVGLGTTSPSQALEVKGNYVLIDGGAAGNGNGLIDAYIGGDGSGSDVQIGSMNANITAVGFWNHSAGAWMSVSCSSLTIEGGSDLAEPFPISQAAQPVAEGDVVVIDEARPGQLKLTDQPYDTRVAGVISGANGIHPGIQMHQQGLLAGGKNVALTGRVYVQADTSNGAIKPGDLLTTSSIPGHAMKVSDHVRAQGAILGKAMTSLNTGEGLVLVLVTLQ